MSTPAVSTSTAVRHNRFTDGMMLYKEVWAVPVAPSRQALRSDRRTRVAPDLEQIMGHTPQPPLTPDVVQAAEQAPTETPSLFDLAKHGFHDDLAPRVHCTPFRGPHFRRHALLRGGEPVRARSRR